MKKIFLYLSILFFPLLHSEDAQEIVVPYLMPEDHPAKRRLDALFQRSRPLADLSTLQKAGFTLIGDGTSCFKVLTHHRLKGYVLKLCTDDTRHDSALELLIHRVQGAEFIRSVIEKQQAGRHFTVPRKWLYLLPIATRKGPDDCILVAENVYPIDHATNKQRYRENMKLRKLEQLIALIQETGFTDCVLGNMPHCMDGRIAFLDTQHWASWPVGWHRIRSHLKRSHRRYLDHLPTAPQSQPVG